MRCGSRILTAATLSCSYQLSRELEPPSQTASKSFKAEHLPEGIKHWTKK